jgi:hypothetical protein
MSQEADTAQFMLETARERLEIVQQQRRQDGGLVSGFRLAHATAMVKAAERLLRTAQQTSES